MALTTPGFAQLSFDDLQFLSRLGRYGSLRVMAAECKIAPPNLSKRIRRLEAVLGEPVIQRSVKGITPTPFGRRVATAAGEAMQAFVRFETGLGARPRIAAASPLRVAARGFLNHHLAGGVLARADAAGWQRPLHFVDMAAHEAMMAARAGAIHCVVSTESLDLGRAWRSEAVGTLSWGLYVRAGHPILALPPGETSVMAAWRVLGHVFWDGLAMINPDPVGLPAALAHGIGPRVQTVAAALAVVRATDCVAVLPELAVRDDVALGRIVAAPAALFRPQSVTVRLGVHLDSVPDSFYRLVRAELAARLHPR